MKIAITGKGGSGKTTIAAALARQLARSGLDVVAVDADPNPNLGVALGLPREEVEGLESILNGMLAAGHTHNDPTPAPDELLARFGTAAPDGVRLVATGKIERPSSSCLCCGSHTTTRAFFGNLPSEDRVVVADLEAGLNDLLWAEPGAGDYVVVVSDGSAKAVEIARRAADLARSMGITHIFGVANRCPPDRHGDGDVQRLAEALGAESISIPEDPAVEEANQLGVAPIDRESSSSAMRAIGVLAAKLRAIAVVD